MQNPFFRLRAPAYAANSSQLPPPSDLIRIKSSPCDHHAFPSDPNPSTQAPARLESHKSLTRPNVAAASEPSTLSNFPPLPSIFIPPAFTLTPDLTHPPTTNRPPNLNPPQPHPADSIQILLAIPSPSNPLQCKQARPARLDSHRVSRPRRIVSGALRHVYGQQSAWTSQSVRRADGQQAGVRQRANAAGGRRWDEGREGAGRAGRAGLGAVGGDKMEGGRGMKVKVSRDVYGAGMGGGRESRCRCRSLLTPGVQKREVSLWMRHHARLRLGAGEGIGTRQRKRRNMGFLRAKRAIIH
ncbi:hypothetical protein B0H14DRAFT_2634936 [Mycena olivaceomarginata]|nr:hypothetical protein B0H14DRAFT_2634936 [Mycena olivaceomarginata]